MMAVIDVVPPQEDLQKHDMVLEYTHDRPSDPVYDFNLIFHDFHSFLMIKGQTKLPWPYLRLVSSMIQSCPLEEVAYQSSRL